MYNNTCVNIFKYFFLQRSVSRDTFIIMDKVNVESIILILSSYVKSSLSTEKFYIRFLSRPRGTMFFNQVFFKNGNRFAADVQFIVSRNSHGYIAFVKYQAWRMHFHNAVLDRVRERERKRGKDGWMDGWVDREREGRCTPFVRYFMEPPRVFQLAGALCKREFLAAASVTQKGSRRCIFLCKPRCWLCFRGDKFSRLAFPCEAKVILFSSLFSFSIQSSILFEFDKNSISRKKFGEDNR